MTSSDFRTHPLVILEGPDGSGKTTLMHAINAKLFGGGAELVHLGPLPKVHDGLSRLYLEAMLPALLGHRPVIMDRCWISELVYGMVFRNGTDRCGVASRRMLERVALACGVTLIGCFPSEQDALRVFNSRIKDEYLNTTEEASNVYNAYTQLLCTGELSQLDVLVHNYNVNSVDSTCELITSYYQAGSTKIRGTCGARHGEVLLVGDTFCDVKQSDLFHQFPFVSFCNTGCSRWLTEQLSEAGIQESSLRWVNADNPQLADLFHDEWFHTTTIALGAKAAKQLLAVKLSNHLTCDHPAFHKRFRHGQPYPLIATLKENVIC